MSFFQNSNLAGWVAGTCAPFTALSVFLTHETHNHLMLGVAGILFIVTLLAFACFLSLRGKEKVEAFKLAFGIQIPELDDLNLDERADIQLLVNRILTHKAREFHETRLRQQEHFTKNERVNEFYRKHAAYLQGELEQAKRNFWEASDIARHFRFDVKEKYTEWLQEAPTPATK